MKITKKLLSILLVCVLVLFCFSGLGVTANAAYKTGDVIAFGSYPQARVTDAATLAALNMATSAWQSYDYYIGNGKLDGQMKASDYMKYRDVTYKGQQYRGVLFLKYRPDCTDYTSNAENSSQDENGYTPGTVYWFLYAPLKWRVLDPDTGLILSETIIDSQPLNNYILPDGAGEYGNGAWWNSPYETYYANNYARSDIRTWLNEDFYHTAFTSAQKAVVLDTELDNHAYHSSRSAYDSMATKDKVFLLSYNDSLNQAYGFSASKEDKDAARKGKGSDYAYCQGLHAADTGYSNWRLRSAGAYSDFTCLVRESGKIETFGNKSTSHLEGIRPAITLNLKKISPLPNAQLNVPQSAAVGYKATVTVTAKADNVPNGYYAALYDGNTQLAKGDNKTVSYTMSNMKAGKTLTAKIIDANGAVQSNADGKLEKSFTVNVKTGFFAKLAAFFQGLFGKLPYVELKP